VLLNEGLDVFDRASCGLRVLGLLAVDEKVVATAVEVFQTILRTNARQHSIVNNSNAIAEDVCFFH